MGGLIELGHNRGRNPLGPGELRRLRALYAAEVEYLDRVVDSFFKHLSTLGIADKTLVILLSDHGEEFGEHGKLGHGETLHNQALHVPLAFYWPGVIKPGRDQTPVQLVDVMPTVLDLLSVTPPAKLDGGSLGPTLRAVARPAMRAPLSPN